MFNLAAPGATALIRLPPMQNKQFITRFLLFKLEYFLTHMAVFGKTPVEKNIRRSEGDPHRDMIDDDGKQHSHTIRTALYYILIGTPKFNASGKAEGK